MRYVIAKDHHAFIAYCQDNMIHPLSLEIKYVQNTETLLGREYTFADKFIFYDDWFLRPDAKEIEREVEWCKARRLNDERNDRSWHDS